MDECLFVLVNKNIATDNNNMILFDNASCVKKKNQNVNFDSKYFMLSGLYLFCIVVLLTGLYLLSFKKINRKCIYATLTFNCIYF